MVTYYRTCGGALTPCRVHNHKLFAAAGNKALLCCLTATLTPVRALLGLRVEFTGELARGPVDKDGVEVHVAMNINV